MNIKAEVSYSMLNVKRCCCINNNFALNRPILCESDVKTIIGVFILVSICRGEFSSLHLQKINFLPPSDAVNRLIFEFHIREQIKPKILKK